MATLLIMALKEESQMIFENNGVPTHYCGVGQVKAAFYTQKLINELKPKQVINLGTAGSFTFKQGELVECTSFVQRRANNNLSYEAKEIKTPALTKLKHVRCGTGDFIEHQSSLTPCDVMDMEAYAIAFVCQQMQVPFGSIKYISDTSDHNLIIDWKNHLLTAAQKLFAEFQKLNFSRN